MRSICRRSVLSCLGLVLGLIVLLTSTANADLIEKIGQYDGTNAPTAWISYTGSKGWVDAVADPFTATNWTSNGSPIALYCIDLLHETVLKSSYTVNLESPPTFSTTPRYTDAANRVAWALETAGSTADSRGATQLLIWSMIDKNFSVNWSATKNSGLQADYNLLFSEMGNSQTGYNPNTNYQPGAKFLSAVHDRTNTLYQDLALAVPGFSIASVAPEPSTLVIAGLGALGLIGYGWRRRARPQV